MFGALSTHRVTLTGCEPEDGDAASFRFQAQEPLRWRAGQHVLLRLPGLKIKPFTLASSPLEGSIMIGTSLQSHSPFKRRLEALRPGDGAVIHGPLMNFTLDGVEGEVVMLAQGIGITPFRSMLRQLTLEKDAVADATLLHVAPEHAYRRETEADASRSHYPCHSAEFAAVLTQVVHDQPEAAYFIAGHRAFVNNTAKSLRDKGISAHKIRRDTYYGYAPRTGPHD